METIWLVVNVWSLLAFWQGTGDWRSLLTDTPIRATPSERQRAAEKGARDMACTYRTLGTFCVRSCADCDTRMLSRADTAKQREAARLARMMRSKPVGR